MVQGPPYDRKVWCSIHGQYLLAVALYVQKYAIQLPRHEALSGFFKV